MKKTIFILTLLASFSFNGFSQYIQWSTGCNLVALSGVSTMKAKQTNVNGSTNFSTYLETYGINSEAGYCFFTVGSEVVEKDKMINTGQPSLQERFQIVTGSWEYVLVWAKGSTSGSGNCGAVGIRW